MIKVGHEKKRLKWEVGAQDPKGDWALTCQTFESILAKKVVVEVKKKNKRYHVPLIITNYNDVYLFKDNLLKTINATQK